MAEGDNIHTHIDALSVVCAVFCLRASVSDYVFVKERRENKRESSLVFTFLQKTGVNYKTNKKGTLITDSL